MPMVKEEVPPYAGRGSSSPEACVLDGSLPVYGGNAKKTSQCRPASRVPRRMPRICALTPPRAQGEVLPRCMPERNILFLVADMGAAGSVSGGVPVISLVRFLL